MKGNTSSRTVANICSGAVSLNRDQRRLILVLREDRLLDGLAGAGGLALPQRVQLVEAFDEQQVGELLDDRQRVGDAAGPHRVPDAVDL